VSAAGCGTSAPFSLQVGQCTNVTLCKRTLRCSNLNQNGLVLTFNAIGCVPTNTLCAHDFNGTRICTTSQCQGTVDCAHACLHLTKSVREPSAPPGSPVTYSYAVTNCGNVTLNNVVVVDDNDTPSLTNDDVVVGTLASLPPNGSQTFTYTISMPTNLC